MAEQRGRLAGKVAIVTGAAHGIGAATARAFVQDGAHVVLADVSPAVKDLQAALGEGRSTPFVGDVADPAQVASMVSEAETVFGGLDVLVNNAALGLSATLEELEEADWRRVVDVTLGSVLSGIKHAAPAMRRRGGGSIVNLSSIAAHRAMCGMAAYAAAKAGVEAVTRCAALELRSAGVRVNAVAPAMIRTRAAESGTPALERAVGMPMGDFVDHRQGRWGEPDEVARAVVHLASDEASFATGQTTVLDNGASVLL
ncbi:SDR family NAD(P)-dependent oxidoreductase [Aeromicrobium sp. CTD01-1L150]|uniref:SDR family NAD(P)-dependent oxidoreductase n=1 Tax=Aeromicrobium sp. CTD01-1L150 TaxID=3341830 RepID=UPI0035C11C0D